MAGRRAPTRLGAQDDPAREPQARAAAAAGRVRRSARDAARAPGDAVRGGGDRQRAASPTSSSRAPRGDEGPEGPGQSLRGGRDASGPSRRSSCTRWGGGARAAGGAPGAARGVRPGMHLARRGPADRRAAVHRARHRRRGRDEKRYRVAEIRSGLLALLRGFASRGPVVVVLEDIQAAQTPMLELVEELVREADGIPLLVVCAARYSLVGRPPRVGRRARQLGQPVHGDASLDDSTQLARDAGEGLDEAYAQRIARHAGGNPFFIIETTGMLLHQGKGSRPTPGRCRRRCCRRPCRP